MIFFLAALLGLCIAGVKCIARGILANAWIIAALLIVSAATGYFLNDYLEKHDSAYTASGVVQIPAKPSTDPLRSTPPEDTNALQRNMQSTVARFRDQNMIDELLKDPDSKFRLTKWWNITCAKDLELGRDLLQKNLVVEPVPGSNLVKVAFTAPEQTDCAVIVTAVVNQTMSAQRDFIRNNYDAQRRQTAEIKNRYEIELRNATADVAAMRTELIEFGASPFGVPGGPTELELASRLKERVELQSMQTNIDNADAALKQMREHGQIPPEAQRRVDQDPDIIHARQMLDDFDVRLLADAQNAATQPAATLREPWQHKLDELKAKKLAEALDAYANQIADEKKNIAIKLDHCNGEITRLKAAVADIASKTSALKSREADLIVYREHVKEYDEHLLEVDEATRRSPGGGMDWFARPHVPSTRTFPNLANIMAISIAAGLALGLVIAVIRELAKWGACER